MEESTISFLSLWRKVHPNSPGLTMNEVELHLIKSNSTNNNCLPRHELFQVEPRTSLWFFITFPELNGCEKDRTIHKGSAYGYDAILNLSTAKCMKAEIANSTQIPSGIDDRCTYYVRAISTFLKQCKFRAKMVTVPKSMRFRRLHDRWNRIVFKRFTFDSVFKSTRFRQRSRSV